jgi:putative ABC transport system permease protein
VQISLQVVIETVLITSLALMISIISLYLLFPLVRQFVDVNLRFKDLLLPDVMFLVATMLLVLTIFSAAYPSYQLATNSPINDLNKGTGFGNSRFGKILLLTQFSISIICIAATFIVAQQLDFIQSKNPGYDRHNMIVVYMPDRYPNEKIPVMKNELRKLPGIEAVSYSTFRIAGAGYYRGLYKVEIGGEMKEMMLNEVFFDHDFFKASGIPLVAGRTFDPNSSTDSHEAFIVNEAAVREFGWKDPLGMRISTGFGDPSGEKWDGTIVGVVKDFNVYSLHKKIEPLVMRLPWSAWPGQCLHIKINGPLDQTIASIKATYEEVLPDFLLNYQLIEDIYDNQYQEEQKAFTTLRICTWIIVVISSLGIFSLSAYLSLSRMKEFGIRKVLGASSRQIASLHVGYFMKIALLANAMALPIVYWLMKEWLESFAYRTELGGIIFAAVVMISFLLVIFSAGYSSLKAGRMNPVEVIKIQ